jgi:site-specific recombinase XerD
MHTDLVPTRAQSALDFVAAVASAAGFIRASQAAATRRAYASDWRDFRTWCERFGVDEFQEVKAASLPAAPKTVAAYLGSLAQSGRKASTIHRRCAAIAFVHRSAGHASPIAHPGVKATLAGIARQIGTPPAKKAALTTDLVARAVRKIPEDLAGLRDRAILLLGFAAALRRSELVALEVTDVARHAKGIVLTLRRSKTDQAGAGATKAIPFGRRLHAVAALDRWLAVSQICNGPLFRGVRGVAIMATPLTAGQVARIIKKRCAAIGLDPEDFAGHSLRSGFLTSASDHGAALTDMAKHAGHAKLDTTLGYVQVADAFARHPGTGFL